MAHFSVCIIVESSESSSQELLEEKAASQINAFSYELPSVPHKQYIEEQELEELKKHHQIEDIEKLREAAELLFAEECFIDEHGIYFMSTNEDNPDGHFSWGDLLGRVPPEDFGEAFLGEKAGRLCLAAVTPDGRWLEGPMHFGAPTSPEEIYKAEMWETQLRTLLEEYKDCTFFLADCKR